MLPQHLTEVKVIQAELLDWKFKFTDSGIATSHEIEDMGNELDLFQVPTIIFAKNTLTIEHSSGFRLEYNAKEALKFINYKQRESALFPLDKLGEVNLNSITFIPPKVEIKHAKHWKTLKKPTDIELTEL